MFELQKRSPQAVTHFQTNWAKRQVLNKQESLISHMLHEGEKFEQSHTKFFFKSGVKFYKWPAGTPMPAAATVDTEMRVPRAPAKVTTATMTRTLRMLILKI